MSDVEKTGDEANGDGPDNMQSQVGTPPPSPHMVHPTECADGSKSGGTPHQPYIPVTKIPWINRWKGMNVKNLKRDLADMGYRPFEVSYNEISLYFRLYFISYVLK